MTPALVREVRARLDQAGAGRVKIYVSGGVTPERIPELAAAGADAFGVGSFISDADPIDMTLDLKSLKRAVLRQEKYVQLKDGSVGILPEEWLQKFQRYFRAGEIKDDKLQISKLKFSIIDELF